MLIQLLIDLFHPQGTALRILFLIPAVLFTVSVLFMKCFPGRASFACAVFSGAAYPVFLFLTDAVRPFSEQPEGALRLALVLEILLLALAAVLCFAAVLGGQFAYSRLFVEPSVIVSPNDYPVTLS